MLHKSVAVTCLYVFFVNIFITNAQKSLGSFWFGNNLSQS